MSAAKLKHNNTLPLSSAAYGARAAIVAALLLSLAMASPPAAAQSDVFVDPAARTPSQVEAEDTATRLLLRAEIVTMIGNHALAATSYAEALSVLEGAYGESDYRLVRPLRGVANAHLREGKRLKDGQQALRRVVAILDAYEQRDPNDWIRAYTDLGDYYMYTGAVLEGAAQYAEAWDVVAKINGKEDANKLFALPSRLVFNLPPNEPTEADATLEVSFTIKPTGQTDDIKIRSDNASRKLSKAVKRSFARAQFRPRVVDGNLISTRNLSIRLHFPADGSPPSQLQ